MSLSGTGRGGWPAAWVTSRVKLCEVFSPASTPLAMRLPFASNWPPPPSLSAKAASIRSRLLSTSHEAPLNGPPSSPQVSALLIVRRGLKPSLRDRQSVVYGKSVSVSVNLGGRHIIKQKIKQ